MADQMTFEFTGLDEFIAKTKRVGDRKFQRRLLSATMRAGLNPVAAEMRRQIRSKAVRHKYLAKSIISKLRTYNSGVVYGLVGVRRDKRFPLATAKTGVAIPANYFHLVDEGTQPHAQPGLVKRRVFIDGRWVTLSGQHPGSDPRPIRGPAARKGASRAPETMGKAWGRTMEREMAKRR